MEWCLVWAEVGRCGLMFNCFVSRSLSICFHYKCFETNHAHERLKFTERANERNKRILLAHCACIDQLLICVNIPAFWWHILSKTRYSCWSSSFFIVYVATICPNLLLELNRKDSATKCISRNSGTSRFFIINPMAQDNSNNNKNAIFYVLLHG